ncbi:MAG: hypothetical protein FWG25_06525, partial [Promicromonosporaceae bacterium]|nr:hypothetical protein [Promicromonosporaceae bacterium]
LEIIPATGTPTNWRIEPGPGGTLVTVANTMSDADLANHVTSYRLFNDLWESSGPVLGSQGSNGAIQPGDSANMASGIIELGDMPSLTFEYRAPVGAATGPEAETLITSFRADDTPIQRDIIRDPLTEPFATQTIDILAPNARARTSAATQYRLPNGAAKIRVSARFLANTGATVTLHRTNLIGRAQVTDGPLRTDGPFGRVPTFRGANLATTQSDVDADAATTLARITTLGDVNLSLETLCHPALQLGDLVPLTAPGQPEVAGIVRAVSWAGADGVAGKDTALTLAVNHDDLTHLTTPETTP